MSKSIYGSKFLYKGKKSYLDEIDKESHILITNHLREKLNKNLFIYFKKNNLL